VKKKLTFQKRKKKKKEERRTSPKTKASPFLSNFKIAHTDHRPDLSEP